MLDLRVAYVLPLPRLAVDQHRAGAFDSSEMLSVSGQIYAESHPSWVVVGAHFEDLDKTYPK